MVYKAQKVGCCSCEGRTFQAAGCVFVSPPGGHPLQLRNSSVVTDPGHRWNNKAFVNHTGKPTQNEKLQRGSAGGGRLQQGHAMRASLHTR